MGRGLWFAAGAGTAVYATVKARRVAYRLSASGLADQVAVLRLGARALVDDIGAGTHEREAELVQDLGLAPRETVDPAAPEGSGPSARLLTLTPQTVRKDTS